MTRKVIISLAPSAGPAPVDPPALAADVIRSSAAGAAICHLHCKTRAGALTPDISVLSETFDLIRAGCDIVIQASTGGVSQMSIEQRCNPLAYQYVESASLNGGSTNLGEAVYVNSFDDIRFCADACIKHDIVPEIEVFDIGMLNNIHIIRQEKTLREPVLFNLVFGHRGGLPATIEALTAFRSFVSADALWGVTHFGRDNWTFLAAAIAMGATVVRIGFEDSRWLTEGSEADNNLQLVEKLALIIRSMGLETATADEAREIINARKIK
jgi:3-keto-5-aminohexanoate cleavage enzyme